MCPQNWYLPVIVTGTRLGLTAQCGRGYAAGTMRKARKTPSPEEWAAILHKVIICEQPVRAVAREYNLDEGTIRARIKASPVIDLANKLAAVPATLSAGLSALTSAEKAVTFTLAERLRRVSDHLAAAADYSGQTAARFAMMARDQAEKVDPLNPLGDDSARYVAEAGALQKMANMASDLPLGLMNANKPTIERLNDEGDQPPTPTTITFQIVDAAA